jgi:hypothetical protein
MLHRGKQGLSMNENFHKNLLSPKVQLVRFSSTLRVLSGTGANDTVSGTTVVISMTGKYCNVDG